MNLSEFVAKNKGKFLDWDGKYGNQCVDLIRFFLKDFDLPQLKPGNAIDQWRNNEGFTRVVNTIDAVPIPGDIVIWKGTKSNPYGHIAIVLSANILYMNVIEQNNPTGSPVRVAKHSYAGVIGWLRQERYNKDALHKKLFDAQESLKTVDASSKNRLQRMINRIVRILGQ